MSSSYTLKCNTHDLNVDRERWDPQDGHAGFEAVRWAATAGWLVHELLEANLTHAGDVEVRVWFRGVNGLCHFAHEHADCPGGLTVLRDQGCVEPWGDPLFPLKTWPVKS
jgi:hypothetical protein